MEQRNNFKRRFVKIYNSQLQFSTNKKAVRGYQTAHYPWLPASLQLTLKRCSLSRPSIQQGQKLDGVGFWHNRHKAEED